MSGRPLGSRRLAMPQHARGHAAGNRPIGDRTGDDGARGDHRVAADVGHDHGGAADPRAGADAHRRLDVG